MPWGQRSAAGPPVQTTRSQCDPPAADLQTQKSEKEQLDFACTFCIQINNLALMTVSDWTEKWTQSWEACRWAQRPVPSETALRLPSLPQWSPGHRYPATSYLSRHGSVRGCLVREKWEFLVSTSTFPVIVHCSSLEEWLCVCNVPPFRKQCQAVGGQEMFHPISSSSDREDQVDTAEPHSLLFYRRRKRFRYLLVDFYLEWWW